MRNKRYLLAIILTMCLIPFFNNSAGAGIVDKASQIVNLLAPSNSSVPLPLTQLKKVNTDGTLTDFSLPANTVLVITYVSWRFMPTTANSHPLQFRLFLPNSGGTIYSDKQSVGSDGYASNYGAEITPGIPLSVWNSSLVFSVVDLANSFAFVPGTLNLRVVGFLTPNQ